MQFLLYSPDSYGLGHIRRSVSIAGQLLEAFRDSSARVVTGSPQAHYFEFPDRCKYTKLPQVTKNAGGQYVSGKPNTLLTHTVDLRGDLIGQASDAFRGGVLLVDHSPLGLCGEMTSTLCRLTRGKPGTYRVLGLRDVIDEPEAVKASWEQQQVLRVLRCCYDLILVYGQQELFDPIREYDIPPDIAQKMKFVGYIPRHGRQTEERNLKARMAPRTGRLVVVTLGGGGDGDRILESFLDGYEQLGVEPPFEVAAITGPQMDQKAMTRFRERSLRLRGLTLFEYTRQLPDLLNVADFVVSMGGYNTVCELACAGARSLIVPRTFPRKEQLVRAKLLQRLGVARYLTPSEATPAALIRQTLAAFERPLPEPGWGIEFTGLTRTADAMQELTRGREPLQALPCRSKSRVA
jgi:predicted glycosyltransferase